MDFTLGIGSPDTDIGSGVSLAWVHLRRFTVVIEVSTVRVHYRNHVIGLDVLEEGFYADQSNHSRAGKECACSEWIRTPPWGKLTKENSS